MGFKFDGMKELQNQLKKVEKQARDAVSGEISLGELFTDDFMQKNTNAKSIEEFLNESPMAGKEVETVEAMSTPEMDEYVKAQTEFSSWQEILQEAADSYAVDMFRKAGFKVE
ncbi:hypothetical protein M3193_03660 [Sporosarcina luteola]|uniref:hypothetical protein n=1 Tax=Sporosarcina luteola TaxID=582850 RepID=UPI00203DDC20|nr:hypothetical protein [Sporosarcina luteola]MCM3743229.1 hypothetical protein [Sporosarcina luteola]